MNGDSQVRRPLRGQSAKSLILRNLDREFLTFGLITMCQNLVKITSKTSK